LNVKGGIACEFRIITIQLCITIISLALNRSRRQQALPVLWQLYMRLDGVTSQKTGILNKTTVRT
jgi:hypothetical protein